MTDVDFAGNFVHSTLDGVNLSTATTQTYEKSYVEDDAKPVRPSAPPPTT